MVVDAIYIVWHREGGGELDYRAMGHHTFIRPNTLLDGDGSSLWTVDGGDGPAAWSDFILGAPSEHEG